MTLAYAGVDYELREVVLRNKPQALLDISPKATVPVLQLPNGKVLDESLQIMYWALAQQDDQHWLNSEYPDDATQLIEHNDGQFKYYLDRYKYANRYPQYSMQHYRQQAEVFLQMLQQRLAVSSFLFGEQISLADVAIVPFIRQFASVDLDWFQHWLTSPLFLSVMQKYPAWKPNEARPSSVQ